MTLTEIQTALRTAHKALAQVRDAHVGALNPDTAFAIGEALGQIRHAEALVTRDIADQGIAQSPRHG